MKRAREKTRSVTQHVQHGDDVHRDGRERAFETFESCPSFARAAARSSQFAARMPVISRNDARMQILLEDCGCKNERTLSDLLCQESTSSIDQAMTTTRHVLPSARTPACFFLDMFNSPRPFSASALAQELARSSRRGIARAAEANNMLSMNQHQLFNNTSHRTRLTCRTRRSRICPYPPTPAHPPPAQAPP